MNQKIKEFFSEATFEPDRLVDGVYHPYIPLQFSNEPWRYTITDDGIQKFAELIILEVLSQADEMMRLSETYLDKGIDIELDITKEIKNNFGIE